MALGINLGAFLIGDKDDEIVDELEVVEVIDDDKCVWNQSAHPLLKSEHPWGKKCVQMNTPK